MDAGDVTARIQQSIWTLGKFGKGVTSPVTNPLDFGRVLLFWEDLARGHLPSDNDRLTVGGDG